MKEIIMNTTTNFENAIFEQGRKYSVENKIADRWVNKGVAHVEIDKVIVREEKKVKKEVLTYTPPEKIKVKKSNKKK